MKRLSVTFLTCVICAVLGYSQTSGTATPEFALEMFKTTGLDRQYEIVKHLNPSSLTGDFDGDGKADIAVLVKQKSSKKIGIAVYHTSTGKLFFIGAGTEMGNGGDNFEWMDIWRVIPKASAAKKVGRVAAATLKGDAIYVEKSESASGLIYWNGRKYVWRQQGD
jgi:hypothetical protein